MVEWFGVQTSPVIVTVVEDASRQTTMGDVILGALGLTGMLALLALAIGLCLGASFVWLRNTRPTNSFNGDGSEQLRLRLTSTAGRAPTNPALS